MAIQRLPYDKTASALDIITEVHVNFFGWLHVSWASKVLINFNDYRAQPIVEDIPLAPPMNL